MGEPNKHWGSPTIDSHPIFGGWRVPKAIADMSLWLVWSAGLVADCSLYTCYISFNYCLLIWFPCYHHLFDDNRVYLRQCKEQFMKITGSLSLSRLSNRC